VPDVDIGIALTSQQCHMPDIGTLVPFELIWFHALLTYLNHLNITTRYV